ncbi:unnamed protein product [Periconia digitata]|uniref:Uncharacterized protein n=1 Tax=Periconia digitata TaxID=1303443 RepID=A0A9W4UMA9_9PLEO|nr:unnamed protein product [Periconia digitata]
MYVAGRHDSTSSFCVFMLYSKSNSPFSPLFSLCQNVSSLKILAFLFPFLGKLLI